MYRFVSAPRWFFSYDVATDAIALVITLLIALYGLKLYKYSGDRKHKYFSMSFFLIATSFIFKSLSNLAEASESMVGQIVWAINIPEIASHSMFFIGTYLGYRLFTLIGLFGIFAITHKIKGKSLLIPAYLILVVTLFSSVTYLLFYTTTFVFLLCISAYYYSNYGKVKSLQSLMVFLSFAAIMVGQLIFLGISYKGYLYLVGELFQLIGYLFLLFSYIGLFVKNGKKNET